MVTPEPQGSDLPLWSGNRLPKYVCEFQWIEATGSCQSPGDVPTAFKGTKVLCRRIPGIGSIKRFLEPCGKTVSPELREKMAQWQDYWSNSPADVRYSVFRLKVGEFYDLTLGKAPEGLMSGKSAGSNSSGCAVI